MSAKTPETSMDLTTVISQAIKIPGVKVSRHDFLSKQFENYPADRISAILEQGPLAAGCSREELSKMAKRIIKSCAAFSSSASFLAGLPGGLAMAAAIPADILQFYGVSLRMAQELIYLYGETDLWCDSTPDEEKIQNQLILYCGVMLGASGAAQTVRVMSSALAKQAAKKLPQMALTKTMYYPIIKSILKFFGISITKKTFANGVSKVLPVVGGIVSGGITLASIVPMGNRLHAVLDEAHFDYTEEELASDLYDIQNFKEIEVVEELPESSETSNTIENTIPEPVEKDIISNQLAHTTDLLNQIKEAKSMLDSGLITEDEFIAIKAKLLS